MSRSQVHCPVHHGPHHHHSNQAQTHTLKKIIHFHHWIPLPDGAKLSKYVPAHHSKNKKQKNKCDNFKYYQVEEGKMVKVLYKNDEQIMVQSEYPFTDPNDHIIRRPQLNSMHAKKVLVSEAAYIGHVGQLMVVKKMNGVKLSQQGLEFETVNDQFEILNMGNSSRFQQFLKILSVRKEAIQMSIRVIIDETDPKQPKIIDFQFFQRQAQIKKNNKVYNSKSAVIQNTEIQKVEQNIAKNKV